MLRTILKVPQNPEFHPEGVVFLHARLCRKSLDKAIIHFQEHFPQFSFDKRDRNILRMACWLHDIGKASATTEEIKAIGHEEIPHLLAGFRRLKKSSLWMKIYKNSCKQDRKELMLIIRNHMHHMGKRFQNKWIDDNGQYKPESKLLLAFIVADRMGRGKPYASPCEKMLAAAVEKKARATRIEKPKAPDNLEEFVKYLQDKGVAPQVIAEAVKGKFLLQSFP